ncbi:hypothetical protein VH1709_contig00043-0095 [Vibrio harveyi]|uniref:hypothetical protein n=1 Tax=Vibrio harveyi TaxID=669 RepID=UPI000D78442C|nr:hypothetical protein [Vibrio harveyi]EKO3834667.1 hypothetical protein [Vibrio harveyi]GBL00037.1 hypothetical protein VH1709_contig00043-0095 [Vibrio harveyi]
MTNNINQNVKEVLADQEKIEEFAELNRLTVEAAELLLKRLMERPEMEKEFKEYIFSNDRSEDFKSYTAGEEKGYQRGHDAGFAKGTALGVLGTITMAGLAFLAGKR